MQNNATEENADDSNIKEALSLLSGGRICLEGLDRGFVHTDWSFIIPEEIGCQQSVYIKLSV